MSIEADLKRIADALEKQCKIMEFTSGVTIGDTKPAVTAGPGVSSAQAEAAVDDDPLKLGAGKTAAPATDGKTKKKTAATAGAQVGGEPIPTLDDITDGLRTLVGAKGAPIAKGVLAEFGVDRISLAKPEQYAALAKRMKEVANG